MFQLSANMPAYCKMRLQADICKEPTETASASNTRMCSM